MVLLRRILALFGAVAVLSAAFSLTLSEVRDPIRCPIDPETQQCSLSPTACPSEYYCALVAPATCECEHW